MSIMSRAIILFIGTVAHLDNCARLLFAFHINKHDMSQKSFHTNYHLLYLLITICDLTFNIDCFIVITSFVIILSTFRNMQKKVIISINITFDILILIYFWFVVINYMVYLTIFQYILRMKYTSNIDCMSTHY